MTNPNHVRIPLAISVTPEQQAALVVVIEEASEIVQAATKLLRFGFKAVDRTTDKPYDNYKQLKEEWIDLHNALDRLSQLK